MGELGSKKSIVVDTIGGVVNRENSYPSETAQNEHNDKPGTAPLVPGDRINDIPWRGSTCLCVLQMSNA